MIAWRLCLVFAVIFYSKSATSSCDGSDCSSDSGMSGGVMIIVIIAVILKCIFWIYCCCCRSQQRRSRNVRVYQRLDTGRNTVNVRPRTTQMTSTASQAHGTPPKSNDPTQEGNANPGYDLPPQTILRNADPAINPPPPYTDEISS